MKSKSIKAVGINDVLKELRTMRPVGFNENARLRTAKVILILVRALNEKPFDEMVALIKKRFNISNMKAERMVYSATDLINDTIKAMNKKINDKKKLNDFYEDSIDSI